MGIIDSIFGTPGGRELKKIAPLTQQVLALEDKYKAFTDAELRAMTDKFRSRLAAGETTDDILPDAFAVCREAAARVLNMRHFPVQITGGIVLHNGRIAEMKTGEGKTLVATLPAYLNALTGEGVHIVTVNDYLARRDSEWMGKVYRFLGLTVGLIVSGLTPPERREAYAADITYGTNNEFGFDYLRDNMVVRRDDLVQRGQAYAIVDEVDSILIDEARTPLIISGRGDRSTDMYQNADRFAKTLRCVRITEQDTKEHIDDDGADYIVDEKARSATLTRSGIEKAQQYFSVNDLSDPENLTLSHHINQAIKARGTMRRDVHYVVKDGQVIIVDEFTGRLMIGRRFNEGLHQAIEAKEGVKVERENKTLATITFQNFFRMYKKLSGMTGTALTEADEFNEIYGLLVIEIPTNKPMIREDLNDAIYRTEEAKFNAVIEQICECHHREQPVLVGTVSIEKSELLSRKLSKRGIKHEVLNAKHHEREAQIVAQAGKSGAVTIATNMAGRGTDIILGGNAEYLAKNEMRREGYSDELITAATGYADTDDEEINEARAKFKALHKKHSVDTAAEAQMVRAAGGLFILGTERHESRRIDNQLRGRAGRQGDPGQSKFFLSLEDDLMRLFGGERLQMLLNGSGLEDDVPLEMRMLTSTIENAQKKVEGRNFDVRKNVLQFDDVMNQQRTVIYDQRNKVLNGDDLSESIKGMLIGSIEENVATYASPLAAPEDWNLAGLRGHFLGWLTVDGDFRYSSEQLKKLSSQDIQNLLTERAMNIYAEKEKALGSETMRTLERFVLLQAVDRHWMEHIDSMEELKRGIYLRSYAQQNPVVEYRIEGHAMFDEMVSNIREEAAKNIMIMRLVTRTEQNRPKPIAAGGDDSDSRTVRKKNKTGPNDPCPCGSGKKYKKCCGR